MQKVMVKFGVMHCFREKLREFRLHRLGKRPLHLPMALYEQGSSVLHERYPVVMEAYTSELRTASAMSEVG